MESGISQCARLSVQKKEDPLRHRLSLAWLLPLVLFAQASVAPTGLKILSTTLGEPLPSHPNLRQVTVTVQNITDKTVVAHAFRVHEFDENDQEIRPGGAGVIRDFAGPGLMNQAEMFIRPGQVVSIPIYSAGPKTARVNVNLVGLVYEDRTSEGGNIAGIIFNARANNARQAREAAAKEPPGEKRLALEKQADWFEGHAKEARQ